MKQTKPAQAMELRSLSPVLDGLLEGEATDRSTPPVLSGFERPLGVTDMKLSVVEEMTLSLARGATGKAGDGQIVILLVVALLAGSSLRAQVDLGLVVSAACLLAVLSVLERRQVAEIVRKLERTRSNGSHEMSDADNQ